MKIRILAALALLTASGVALAQASSPSRADVKAETKAAEKNRQLTPAGESSPTPPAGTGSTKTKEQRKAETLEARKKGELAPAGSTQKADVATQKQPTTTDRAKRKADTAAAEKAGKLTPAGEGPDAPKK
jgi:hypothetical protein